MQTFYRWAWRSIDANACLGGTTASWLQFWLASGCVMWVWARSHITFQGAKRTKHAAVMRPGLREGHHI